MHFCQKNCHSNIFFPTFTLKNQSSPLSWAMGERVICKWAASCPFPELCGAMPEPAKQQHWSLSSFEHSGVTMQSLKNTKADTWRESVQRRLNSRLCSKRRSIGNGFIFAFNLLRFRIKEVCVRVLKAFSSWRTTFVFPPLCFCLSF